MFIKKGNKILRSFKCQRMVKIVKYDRDAFCTLANHKYLKKLSTSVCLGKNSPEHAGKYFRLAVKDYEQHFFADIFILGHKRKRHLWHFCRPSSENIWQVFTLLAIIESHDPCSPLINYEICL